MSQMFHQGRLNLRIRPDLDFARQNPLADQFLRRTPNLVELRARRRHDPHRRRGGRPGRRRVGRWRHPDERTEAARASEVGGGTRTARNKWTGTTFTGRHWADLSPAEQAQTEAGTLFLLRKHGWNIGGNHNMGSQAATIVLETLSTRRNSPTSR